jgi:uncharacterized membrane protein
LLPANGYFAACFRDYLSAWVLADWRRGIAAVAACANVVLKLGGV